MNTDSISFDVGTNFDYKLFDIIEQYDPKHSITSIYGKLRYDGLPGGRAAAIVPNLTFDEFAAYVAECTKRGIQFNYLINPIGLDQNELDPVEGKKLRDFIGWDNDSETLQRPHTLRHRFPRSSFVLHCGQSRKQF